MTEKMALAVLAAPINHISRPGTEGVIEPSRVKLNYDDNLWLLPRSTCERDINYRQIIPYITLITDNHEVMSFRQVEEDSEMSRVDKRSIGLSPHIEYLPEVEDVTKMTSDEWHRFIVEEALRKVEEEVGLKHIALYREQMLTTLRLSKYRYLILNDTMEEQTHLGIHLFLRVNPQDITKGEDDVTKDRRWSCMKLLYEKHYDSEISLERWSISVIDHYLSGNRY